MTALATSVVVNCQTWMMRSFCSCSVNRPRRKSRCTISTSFRALSMISGFSFGTLISETAMVVPERMAYSNPMRLISSAASQVTSCPYSS